MFIRHFQFIFMCKNHCNSFGYIQRQSKYITIIHCRFTCIFAPLYFIQPGTVVSVVNSYSATSEYTPASVLNNVDFPTEGKPVNLIIGKNHA